jgi:hypothetical protein
MTNGRLALARLALGPIKAGAPQLPGFQKPEAPAQPSEAIASLAREWLGKLWGASTSDRKPPRRA